MRSTRTLIWVGWLAMAFACRSNPTASEEDPLSVIVDESIQPPEVDVGKDREIAALVDPDGEVAAFVENELLLVTDDAAELDAFLERHGGEVLLEIDPGEAKLEELSRMVLVRVRLEETDASQLESDLAALAEEHGLGAQGEHRISSTRGAALLAMAADEKLAGLDVGVNWILEDTAIPDDTEEAPVGPGGYVDDAYQWSQWRRSSAVHIGVPEAWSLLHYAGKLGRRVKIGILDGGFAPDTDFRSGVGVSVVPFVFEPLFTENAANCSGGGACPWHGTWVGSAAMAIPDNGYGSAGTGGPVGEPVFIYTTPDYVISIAAVIAARAEGAKVINMSYSARVPTIVAWTVYPFEATTKAVRSSGALLFAAAGNSGENVDREDCVPVLGWPCWEVAWHTPCENDGVICVGGFDSAGNRDPSSNFGSEHVDFYAPFSVLVGPDPDHPANEAQTKSGTSLSSPFAAGVAALVWAADPSLHAGDVWNLMKDTASQHAGMRRVNAYGAVLGAIDLGLGVSITSPYDGADLASGVPSHFMADVSLVSLPGAPVDVEIRWDSSRDGLLRVENRTLSRTNPDGTHVHAASFTGVLSAGTHTVTVSAYGPGGLQTMDQVVVTVTNSPPEATILQPGSGEEFCAGEMITFRGSAFDMNETLTEDAFQWSSNLTMLFGFGSVVSRDNLPAGDHVITFCAADSDGGVDCAQIAIRILSASHPDCVDLPPQAVITSPANNASMQIDGYDAAAGAGYKDVELRATVSDDHDSAGDLTVEWYSDVEGYLGSGASLDTRLHLTHSCSQTHEITVRVTDSAGNVSEDTVRIHLWVVC